MSPALLYAVAATVWLFLAFATWNMVYLILAAVFMCLPSRSGKSVKTK